MDTPHDLSAIPEVGNTHDIPEDKHAPIDDVPAEVHYNQAMKSDILKELTTIFNAKLRQFFTIDVHADLETLVEAKLTEMANQSTQNSILDQTIAKPPNDDRITKLEETSEAGLQKINDRLDALNTELKGKNEEIMGLIDKIKTLKKEMNV